MENAMQMWDFFCKIIPQDKEFTDLSEFIKQL